MFILHDIFKPLKNEFSSSKLGHLRSKWFAYVLLSFIIPFTSSMSLNILRCLQTFSELISINADFIPSWHRASYPGVNSGQKCGSCWLAQNDKGAMGMFAACP